jgi:hypothetical protein
MSLNGTWNITAQTPVGQQKATFVLAAQGGTLTGQLLTGDTPTEIFEGAINGNRLSWKVKIQRPTPRTVEFTGTWKENQMSGSARAGLFGNASFTGVRVP